MQPDRQRLVADIPPIMQAGYVHRDLRWDNTACSLERCYFLLDLELCAKPGLPPFLISSWPDGILQDSDAYTETSDILALGHMLSELNVVTSPGGHAFLQRMWPAANSGCVPDRAPPTAEVLLCDAWISCIGDSCKTAGAQPTTVQPVS